MACPKGIPNNKCPGNGDVEKCRFYDMASGKCYRPTEIMRFTQNKQ